MVYIVICSYLYPVYNSHHRVSPHPYYYVYNSCLQVVIKIDHWCAIILGLVGSLMIATTNLLLFEVKKLETGQDLVKLQVRVHWHIDFRVVSGCF